MQTRLEACTKVFTYVWFNRKLCFYESCLISIYGTPQGRNCVMVVIKFLISLMLVWQFNCRRFFSYMVPFRAAFAGYSYNQQNFSRELAMTHPELTLPLLAGKIQGTSQLAYALSTNKKNLAILHLHFHTAIVSICVCM